MNYIWPKNWPAGWTLFCNAWQDCQVLRTGMWIHQASRAELQVRFLFLGGWHSNCLSLLEDMKGSRRRSETTKALTSFFFLEKVERSLFNPYMEWKTVSWLEHISGMGINSFLLISIHGSSFFLFTDMDFRSWNLKSKHLWIVIFPGDV